MRDFGTANPIIMERPLSRFFLRYRRLLHEVAHVRRKQGNDMHHPGWHCCTFVGHGLRLSPRVRMAIAGPVGGRCRVDPFTRRYTRKLMRKGFVVLG